MRMLRCALQQCCCVTSRLCRCCLHLRRRRPKQVEAERALAYKSFDYRVLARPSYPPASYPERARVARAPLWRAIAACPLPPSSFNGNAPAFRASCSSSTPQNLLMYGLRGAEPDAQALEFLSESEVLVELSDDLCALALSQTQTPPSENLHPHDTAPGSASAGR